MQHPRLRLIAGLVLGLLAMGGAGAAECELHQVAKIMVDGSRHGVPVVPVTIDGNERHFLVATEMPYSALTAEAAHDLGLQPVPMSRHRGLWVAGTELSSYTTVESFAVGEAAASNVRFVIVPPVAAAGVDGVLGANLLRHYDVELDFVAGLLRLFEPQGCKVHRAYWTQDFAAIPFTLSAGNHLVLPVTLDGKTLSGTLNTAAEHSRLSGRSAKSHFDLTAQTPGAQSVAPDPSGKSPLRFTYRFHELDLQGIAVRNPLLYVHGDVSEQAFDKKNSWPEQLDPVTRRNFDRQDVELGMDVLGQLRLYIAYGEHTLYVSEARAH